MMDGSSLYPEGFHPVYQYRHPTIIRMARAKRRLHSSPVKYYFIDFDLSTMYNEEWGTDPRNWRGSDGRERDAPEMRYYSLDTSSYNAYVLDVFVLGKVYERSLLERYSNIDFLKPIVEGMTREDPTARITLEDALIILSTIRRSLNIFRMRARLHLRKESKRQIFLRDMRALISDISYILKYFFSHSFSGVRSWRALLRNKKE